MTLDFFAFTSDLTRFLFTCDLKSHLYAFTLGPVSFLGFVYLGTCSLVGTGLWTCLSLFWTCLGTCLSFFLIHGNCLFSDQTCILRHILVLVCLFLGLVMRLVCL